MMLARQGRMPGKKEVENMAENSLLSKEEWEDFDAEALFPPPRLHTNRLTKVDRKDIQYVDPESLGEQLPSPSEGESTEPQDGDQYTDAPPDTGHVDKLFGMEGLEDGTPEAREIRADKEEERRTQLQEPEAKPQGKTDGSEEENDSGQADGPAEPEEGSEAQPSLDGAEKPIQRESEEVEEVAEATSKTSEDIHGGDEAAKDIEDSPNAADAGQNPDNQGANSGESGEDGEGDQGQGDNEQVQGGNAEGEAQGDPLAQEGWEAKADRSACHLQLQDSLEELEAKVREEQGHRTFLPYYQFDREESPAELEVAFQKGRELIQKLAAEQDFTARVSGQQRWDPKALLRAVVSYRHPRIPSSRYDRPREADIVMLLDISGSCAQQAEMFMAIAAGAIGQGVRIYVGYNGSAKAREMEPPRRPLRSYAQAKSWVQEQTERIYELLEWSFREFVEETRPKTLVIFGDWDGIDQYQDVVSDPKFRSVKFFWFANEGIGNWQVEQAGSQIPERWTRKNYFPGIYTPRDLVRALRKLR